MDDTATLVGWRKQDRRVSSMTVDQLHRKRAIDRENQRTLRRSQKSRIDELSSEIQQLKLKLEASEQEKIRLRTQQSNTQAGIDAAISSLQDLHRANDEGDNGVQIPGSSTSGHGHSDFAAQEPLRFSELDNDQWDLGSTVMFPIEESGQEFGLEEFSLDLGALAARGNISSPESYAPTGQEIRDNPVSPSEKSEYHAARIEANQLRQEKPIWSIVPTYSSPTNAMDELVMRLILGRKLEHERGGNTAEFTELSFPSVKSLLNPILHEPENPVSSTIARHVAQVINVHTFPEKVALLYMTCILLRWNICPTEHHFDAIPAFFRPTAAQLLVRYPVWVDTIGWPEARSRIIRHMDFSRYREFAGLITKSFSVNWPHGLSGILQHGLDGNLVLVEGFIYHIREPANWTVGRVLVDTFPFLEGAVNVKIAAS